MDVEWDDTFLFVDGKRFFVQGMNLFLDARRLEVNPRWIYTPPVSSEALVNLIIPKLVEAGVNTVRIWPTSREQLHRSSIPASFFEKFADAGIAIILNLPVNWNLKPPFSVIRAYLRKYLEQAYPNIVMYCISNETYHGFLAPVKYIDGVNKLVKKFSTRPTLATNSNLNVPTYTGSDIIGADYFMYKWSISREGNQDVGSVARMFFEDAREVYQVLPNLLLKVFPYIQRFTRWLARKENESTKYFRRQIYRKIKVAKKIGKPLLIAEYGYSEDLGHFERIWPHMCFSEDIAGHVWYSWINFDPDMDGEVENTALFKKFAEKIAFLERACFGQ